jgi:endonuclease III
MPTLGNPDDPIDDVVFVSLSNKTNPRVASQIFDNLKRAFPTWDRFVDARKGDLESLLRPAGLWRKRAEYLQGTLRQIYIDFGAPSLDTIKRWRAQRAIKYLTSLPGVSEKVARCVMMYTLGFKVLPVDVHVHRVATRLGWTKRRRPDQCHQELEGIVPRHWRFSFHVDAIEHGRRVCKPSNPNCSECCIRRDCVYHKARRKRTTNKRDR